MPGVAGRRSPPRDRPAGHHRGGVVRRRPGDRRAAAGRRHPRLGGTPGGRAHGGGLGARARRAAGSPDSSHRSGRSDRPARRGARRSAPTRRAVTVAGLLNGVDAALLLALLPLADGHWTGGEAGYGLGDRVLGFGALAAPLLWWLGRSATTRTWLGLVLLALAIGAGAVCARAGLGAAPAGARGRRDGARRGRADRDDPGRRTRQRAGRCARADRQRDGRRRPGRFARRAVAGRDDRRPGLVVLLAATTLAAASTYVGMRRGRAAPVAIPAQRTAPEVVAPAQRPQGIGWRAS